MRAPKGGVAVRGIGYRPGQFIPVNQRDMKAGYEQWKRVQEQAAKYSRGDGSVDTEAVIRDLPCDKPVKYNRIQAQPPAPFDPLDIQWILEVASRSGNPNVEAVVRAALEDNDPELLLVALDALQDDPQAPHLHDTLAATLLDRVQHSNPHVPEFHGDPGQALTAYRHADRRPRSHPTGKPVMPPGQKPWQGKGHYPSSPPQQVL